MSDNRRADFITDGAMAVRGEHIYIRLTNPFIAKSYLFHIPTKLFCMIVKNRVIEKDEYVFRTKEEIEDMKSKEKDEQINNLGLYQ